MTGAVPQARGTVTEVQERGSLRLAVIDWDQPDPAGNHQLFAMLPMQKMSYS
jgi:hypothetical protein